MADLIHLVCFLCGLANYMQHTHFAAQCSSMAEIQILNLSMLMQVNHLLELGDRSQGNDRYEAIDKWSKQLNALHSTVVNKLQC